MLRSFEIQGFRVFHHLTVPELGRVNLIVGRNNVGKTMLLEALRLHATNGSPRALRNLLIERDEIYTDTLPGEEEQAVQLRFASLFHRQPATGKAQTVIRLGELGQPSRQLSIRACLLRRVRERDRTLATAAYRYELAEPQADDNGELHLQAGLLVTQGEHERIYPFAAMNGIRPRPGYREDYAEPVFIPARGASERELARWWDVIALRDSESRVIDCLRLIAPIERVNLVEHPYRRGERLVLVRVANETQPIPLKSMGDGLSRIFQIALAMENSRSSQQDLREGVPELFEKEPEGKSHASPALLIDELENGIHYSVHPKLWTFLLQMARRHDVQVFATSHSWDCIAGLKDAAALAAPGDVALIRIERNGEREKAVVFHQHELGIITRDDIEVR